MVTPTSSSWVGWSLARIAIVVGFVLLILGSIIALGPLLQDQLAKQERYQVPFRSIECNIPEDQTRDDFLDEVEYLSGISEQLNLMDSDLRDKLTKAFQKHPKVQRVEKIQVTPPKQLQVVLRFSP